MYTYVNFKLSIVILYIRNFSPRDILAKMTLERCVKYWLSPIFPIQRLSMKGNGLTLFSLGFFFWQVRESQPQRKLNPHKKSWYRVHRNHLISTMLAKHITLTSHCRGRSPACMMQLTTVNILIFCMTGSFLSPSGFQNKVNTGCFCSLLKVFSLMSSFWKLIWNSVHMYGYFWCSGNLASLADMMQV